MSDGWYKCTRSPEVLEVGAANIKAMWLAHVIAHRARWSSQFNRFGCELGEAVVSDHEAYGLSRQEFRTAKDFLVKYQFATFRTTTKGTIAKLSDARLFCTAENASNQQPNQQPTNEQPVEQPTLNQRPTSGATTNGEGEKGRRERKREVPPTPAGCGELENFRIRICSWIGRRANTIWTPKEIQGLKAVLALQTPEEDLMALERWFADPKSYHRKDVPALLNNWNAEIDRAKGTPIQRELEGCDSTNGHTPPDPGYGIGPQFQQ